MGHAGRLVLFWFQTEDFAHRAGRCFLFTAGSALGLRGMHGAQGLRVVEISAREGAREVYALLSCKH